MTATGVESCHSAMRSPSGSPSRRLATVLSQTFRALIHSRMRVGMDRYDKEFPDADVVLLEPAQDEVIFFANMFGYADRRGLAEHRLPPHAGGTEAPRGRT
jgi:NTE family protein